MNYDEFPIEATSGHPPPHLPRKLRIDPSSSSKSIDECQHSICITFRMLRKNLAFYSAASLRFLSFKGAMSFLLHVRANDNKLENINPIFLSSVGDFRKAVFICLYLSHHLIVSAVLYQESFYGDYRRIFVSFLKLLFALGICLPGFTVSSYQRPLDWQRINDHYSTMSDGILDGIFLIWFTEPFC